MAPSYRGDSPCRVDLHGGPTVGTFWPNRVRKLGSGYDCGLRGVFLYEGEKDLESPPRP